MGHCVYASAAKTVSPILSLGRAEINSVATLLAACIRFGCKSSASILVLASIASIMSMPSTCEFFQEFLPCGRAIIIIIKAIVMSRSTNGVCIRRSFIVGRMCLYAYVSDIVMDASRLLWRRKYHTAYGISSNSSRRTSLFANVIIGV